MTINATPKLSEEAGAALDAVLVQHLKTTPAVAFGVTTKDGIIYIGYRGDRVYNKPEEGQVDETTSTSTLEHLAAMQKHLPELLRRD